jgi:hypothetical protein
MFLEMNMCHAVEGVHYICGDVELHVCVGAHMRADVSAVQHNTCNTHGGRISAWESHTKRAATRYSCQMDSDRKQLAASKPTLYNKQTCHHDVAASSTYCFGQGPVRIHHDYRGAYLTKNLQYDDMLFE